jgi:hypothetical protein
LFYRKFLFALIFEVKIEMKTRLLFVLSFILTYCLSAQDDRVNILGSVLTDTLSVENIHVLNLSTNIGVVTNSKGQFEIEVQVSDTLFFSGIQFREETVLITEDIFEERSLSIKLNESWYSMDEVLLRKKLTGYLIYDSAKNSNDVEVVTSSALDFSSKNFLDSRTIIDEDSRKKTSDNSEVGGGRGSGLFYIASLLIRPITKPIDKIIRRKSVEKKKRKLFKQNVKDAIDWGIRDSLGDFFFIDDLDIPVDHINLFIEYCAFKKIGELYVNGQKLKLIDVFLKESENYKTINNL